MAGIGLTSLYATGGFNVMLESELQHSRGATMRLIHRNTDLDYGPSEELRWILSLTVGTSKSHSRHQQKLPIRKTSHITTPQLLTPGHRTLYSAVFAATFDSCCISWSCNLDFSLYQLHLHSVTKPSNIISPSSLSSPLTFSLFLLFLLSTNNSTTKTIEFFFIMIKQI